MQSKTLVKLIQRFPLLGKLIDWAKQKSFIGLDGVPIYDIIVLFIKEVQREAVIVRASSIAFNALLAFFPSLLFLFTLIPYLPLDDLTTIVYQFKRVVAYRCL